MGYGDMPIFSLAERLEEIYRPGCQEPIVLPRESYALQLLQQIRDESHRFGITRHRYLRGKGQTMSVLDTIPGIGEKRRVALVYTFFRKEAQAAAEVITTAMEPTNEEKLAVAVAAQEKEDLNG